LDVTWGGSAHQYLGEHFGELTQLQWAFGVDRNHRYYEGHSAKNDAQSYVRMNIRLNKKWDLYGDLQGRWVDYKTDGVDNDLLSYAVDTQFVFFNPKAGIEYRPSQKWRYYVSVARGNKEPNRNDFVDVNRATSVKHESMIDGELGVERQSKDLFWAINGYWMQYQNQLVLNGQLNDVGAPLRINVDKSYRAGIEAQASYLIKRNNNQQWSAQGNATWSHNRIAFFEQVVYDYSEDDVRIVSEKLKNVPISFSPDWIAGAQLRYDRFTLYPEELTMRTVTAEEAKIRTRAPFSVMLMWKLVGQQMMDNTGNKDLQIDAYQVWDGRVSYEWISKTHGAACEFSFGVNNILNLDYVSNGYTYSYIWGDKVTERFYYPQALRTWNIGLKVTI
jgi:iron complex outermembrane receptor protein